MLDHRERTYATLGRGQENDLVIKGNLVSRLHARPGIDIGPLRAVEHAKVARQEHAFEARFAVRPVDLALQAEDDLGESRALEPGGPAAIATMTRNAISDMRS
ncbi:MAG: FHA domain-containing protein [Pseudanabaena sp. CRU_2_10]|nr:FHA domain-containing protein [Pseudanabaena sp. CRU_2_10]